MKTSNLSCKNDLKKRNMSTSMKLCGNVKEIHGNTTKTISFQILRTFVLTSNFVSLIKIPSNCGAAHGVAHVGRGCGDRE
jgi:hypothetical protein